jgi:hypothetical protein
MPITRILLGDVRPLDRDGARAEAVAWRDGHIVAVGARDDVTREVGSGVETWDTKGATIVPGFLDAHHHPCLVALYGGATRLAPPMVTNIVGLQRALAGASRTLPPGTWLVATEWDELLLEERRPPTRRELDDAVPDRPLFALHYTCHRALANSRALELAGIGARTQDPEGGVISRGNNGLPDGLLIERGMSHVESLARASLTARDVDGFIARLASHHRALAAAGITHVTDATVPRDLAELYREAARRNALVVPTTMMPVSTTGYLEGPHDALDGPPTGTEAGLLAVGPLKLIFDGAPGCSMCVGWLQAAGATLRAFVMSVRWGSLDPIRMAFSASPRLGRKVRTGIAIYSRQEARETVRAGLERGFAIATHAIGNEAINVALEAYEAAGSRLHDLRAPRLEHAAFVSRDQVKRIAAIGAVIAVQPNFVSLPAYASAPKIPGLRTIALRSFLDAGIRLVGSSDYPVTGFAPLDAIRASVFRRTARRRILDADERISLDDALALYTRVAAEACGHGHTRGTLGVGKRADFVVFGGPLRHERDLDGLDVRATVIGGEIVCGTTS